MNGNIEELVLSGKLFNPPSRSSSPVRSRSPSPSIAAWPNDDTDFDYDSDAERRKAIEHRVAAAQEDQDSIGLGPGRTGVKGVIRDRAEAVSLARSKRAQEIRDLNHAMEKASLGGKTWAEEERDRLAEKTRLEGGMDETRMWKGRFGHLREVGVSSFVQAVEEDRNVWVLVHIYDPSLDRCASLDDELSRLARLYPSTKFLRARAGALGFASTSSSNSYSGFHSSLPLNRSHPRRMFVPGNYPGDEDDPFADNDESNVDSQDPSPQDEWEDDAVDTDVLPTLLVYRGGQLEHAWVRVDWEAKSGMQEFLRQHNVVSDADIGMKPERGLSLSDDDDFDDGGLIFGGSDDEVA
ncbi:hypothetical protein SCP_1500640 [Sparassis crispa]|uniref:Uncharacterized protein n=1 Tax=Sparassis crispa TaxID=139825 RepID=A0A401H3S4_9APHY|nr:hypothetical protein SCP_1500640 [Sparassis crispa]GBE89062.1 hypothetical protein SCP_1500640 [Sparassis crispa]